MTDAHDELMRKAQHYLNRCINADEMGDAYDLVRQLKGHCEIERGRYPDLNRQLDEQANRIGQLIEAIIQHKAECAELDARNGTVPNEVDLKLWSVLVPSEAYQREKTPLEQMAEPHDDSADFFREIGEPSTANLVSAEKFDRDFAEEVASQAGIEDAPTMRALLNHADLILAELKAIRRSVALPGERAG